MTFHGKHGSAGVPFVSTPIEVVRRMLKMAEVKPSEIVYDLGAGDGRVVIIAAKEFGAHAVGIEIDEKLVQRALKKVRKQGLEDRVKILHGNVYKSDIHDADVVVVFLSASDNDLLKPIFEEQLKLGARIVSENFPFTNWKPTKHDFYKGRWLYLYTMGKHL